MTTLPRDHNVNQTSIRYESLLQFAITGCFLLLSAIGILRHEIWLDEAQHFLLARDSHSIAELIRNCEYEGHPLLWNMLLFFLTRLTDDVVSMQILHILISSITVYLIAGSKLNWTEKIGIIFSYFIFFEYNIISRNYGLSALFIVMAVQHFGRANQSSVITLSIILLLLANTHLYALIFTAAFVLCILIADRNYFRRPRKQLFIAGSILLAGWVIAALSILPPTDYLQKFSEYDSTASFSNQRLIKIASVGLKGIFYIPAYNTTGHEIQNSFWIFNIGLKNWQLFFLSAVAIAVPALIIRKNKFALILYLLFLAFYSCFNYFLPLITGVRYFGFFFVVFVVCYLISLPTINRTGRLAALAIFFLQFANGIYFFAMDVRHPFSQSKEIAENLEELSTADPGILILDQTIRPGISAYTGKEYFGVETGLPETYCKWPLSLDAETLKLKVEKQLSANENMIIVADKPDPAIIDTVKLKLIAEPSHSMLKGERIKIYWYK